MKEKKELFLLIVKEKKKEIKTKSVNSEFIMSFLHD